MIYGIHWNVRIYAYTYVCVVTVYGSKELDIDVVPDLWNYSVMVMVDGVP
jgi:hypothetical protein